VRLRDSLVAAFLAADSQVVVGESVREFRDGRGHGAKNAMRSARGPSSSPRDQNLDEVRDE
jgi:hypothetical protein